MEDQTLVQVGLGVEVYMEVDRKYYANSFYLWTWISFSVTALHIGELKWYWCTISVHCLQRETEEGESGTKRCEENEAL